MSVGKPSVGAGSSERQGMVILLGNLLREVDEMPLQSLSVIPEHHLMGTHRSPLTVTLGACSMDEFPGHTPFSHLRAPGNIIDSAVLYAILLPTQGIQARSQG